MQYFNLIFTNHAIQRADERGLTKEIAWETFNHPNESHRSKNGGMEFIKYYDGFRTTVIAKQNEKNEWIVISFWRDPPLAGTRDEKKKKNWENYKKAGALGKIWIAILEQLGF